MSLKQQPLISLPLSPDSIWFKSESYCDLIEKHQVKEKRKIMMSTVKGSQNQYFLVSFYVISELFVKFSKILLIFSSSVTIILLL